MGDVEGQAQESIGVNDYCNLGPREAIHSERLLLGRCLILSSRDPIQGVEFVSDGADMAVEIRAWPGDGDLVEWLAASWLRRGLVCERSEQYRIEECDVEAERSKVLAVQEVRRVVGGVAEGRISVGSAVTVQFECSLNHT